MKYIAIIVALIFCGHTAFADIGVSQSQVSALDLSRQLGFKLFLKFKLSNVDTTKNVVATIITSAKQADGSFKVVQKDNLKCSPNDKDIFVVVSFRDSILSLAVGGNFRNFPKDYFSQFKDNSVFTSACDLQKTDNGYFLMTAEDTKGRLIRLTLKIANES